MLVSAQSSSTAGACKLWRLEAKWPCTQIGREQLRMLKKLPRPFQSMLYLQCSINLVTLLTRHNAQNAKHKIGN